ncbi:hypothetical protein [Phormidesmis sp. 146-33]
MKTHLFQARSLESQIKQNHYLWQTFSPNANTIVQSASTCMNRDRKLSDRRRPSHLPK